MRRWNTSSARIVSSNCRHPNVSMGASIRARASGEPVSQGLGSGVPRERGAPFRATGCRLAEPIGKSRFGACKGGVPSERGREEPMTLDPKRAAARAALDEVPASGGIIGLGSGSTARLFVEELAERVRAGLRVTGVPTSEDTRALATRCGIPLLGDEGPWSIEVNVDGADEVSAALDLVKGGGAAHTREKIVNFAAKKNVIIVDETN